jgi:nucleoside-diphosphate-sugar epimerase
MVETCQPGEIEALPLKGLIGYTGFVGGTLCHRQTFDSLYNSSNISQIEGQTFDLLVCAGAPAVKWQANKQPEADLQNLLSLATHLEKVTAHHFVLISTVDVYPHPVGVDEDSTIDETQAQPYGKHRHILESRIRAKFPHALIVRLPGLFGKGLKKNPIYDLMHNNAVELIHSDSRMQFYDLDNLPADLERAAAAGLKLVNFATEPVVIKDIARRCFDHDFTNKPANPPANYDMQTKHATAFGKQGRYLYSADYTFEHIQKFVRMEIASSI